MPLNTGVKRQYVGCAGQVANGVNTVHCSYATRGGHALIGARLYLPAEQLDDPDRRTALGIPTDVVFRTKPQLAIDSNSARLAAKRSSTPAAAVLVTAAPDGRPAAR